MAVVPVATGACCRVLARMMAPQRRRRAAATTRAAGLGGCRAARGRGPPPLRAGGGRALWPCHVVGNFVVDNRCRCFSCGMRVSFLALLCRENTIGIVNREVDVELRQHPRECASARSIGIPLAGLKVHTNSNSKELELSAVTCRRMHIYGGIQWKACPTILRLWPARKWLDKHGMIRSISGG